MVAHVLARGDLQPLVVVLGGLVAGLVAILQSSRRRQQVGRLGRILAARLGGRFESAGLFSNAKLLFPLEGRPAVLHFQTGRNPQTYLRVWLPRDPGGSLRISRDSFAQIFITAMDGRRFRVGDRLFDQLFAVRSYPESLGRRVFSPARRQEAMTAVRRLNHCSGLALEVHPAFLEVRIGELADTPEVALAMVSTAEDFLRFLYEVDPEPGILWGSVVELPSGRCPICTSTLAEPLVRCSRCLTPHHQDCWRYLGRCSTYGCEPRSGQRAA